MLGMTLSQWRFNALARRRRAILGTWGECRMHPLLKPKVAFLAALLFGVSAMYGLQAQTGAGVEAAVPIPERGGSSLRIKGDVAALHVEVRQTTIADVLSALAVRYHASVSLDEVIEGTYAGSLAHVVSRVLDGYNYATKQSAPNFEVIIFGRRGESAVPAPIIIPVRRRPSD
jgi:hypothetical protein